MISLIKNYIQLSINNSIYSNFQSFSDLGQYCWLWFDCVSKDSVRGLWSEQEKQHVPSLGEKRCVNTKSHFAICAHEKS